MFGTAAPKLRHGGKAVTSLDQGIIVLFLPVLVNSLMDILASLFVQCSRSSSGGLPGSSAGLPWQIPTAVVNIRSTVAVRLQPLQQVDGDAGTGLLADPPADVGLDRELMPPSPGAAAARHSSRLARDADRV
jgi:hypothetical protein